MSLRQKSIEILFSEFVKKHLVHFGHTFPENTTAKEVVRSVMANKLYEKAMTVIDQLQESSDSTNSNEGIQLVCDKVRSHFKLPKIYFFSVNQEKKIVEMVYGYPVKTKKVLPVNSHFLKKLSQKNDLMKFVEVIISYFQIEFPDLYFEPFFREKDDIQFLFYQLEQNNMQDTYLRLFDFIFRFQYHKHYRHSNARKVKPEKTSTKEDSSSSSLSAKSSGKIQISPSKINLYQRLIYSLPLLIGDSLEELNQAAKLLLQVAKFYQVVLSDGNLKKLHGIFSLDKAAYNHLKEETIPAELKKQFLDQEKNHCARKIKTSSGKYLLLFFKKAIHPQKKSPDLPFGAFLDSLEKILLRRKELIKPNTSKK